MDAFGLHVWGLEAPWSLVGGWRLLFGGWKAGNGRLESGGGRVEAGEWRLESRGWRVENINMSLVLIVFHRKC